MSRVRVRVRVRILELISVNGILSDKPNDRIAIRNPFGTYVFLIYGQNGISYWVSRVSCRLRDKDCVSEGYG